VSPGRPPPPSAKNTVGNRIRWISSNSRQHRARAAVAEELAVHTGGPGHQAIGWRPFDQLVQLTALTLCRDREPPILHERPGVDEVRDVLPSRAGAHCVSPFDGLRSSGILR
jgi:hypothetical protein